MLALRVRVRDNVELARGRYDFGKVVTLNEATRRMLEVARKAAQSDHTTILHPAARREWDRQERVRESHSLCKSAGSDALAGTQLRRPARYAAGE